MAERENVMFVNCAHWFAWRSVDLQKANDFRLRYSSKRDARGRYTNNEIFG